MNSWNSHDKRDKPKARTDSAEREEISGVVESVIYRSEDTGYTVCSVRLPGKTDTATVVGKCAAIWVGENLRAEGVWVRHKQHGHQFQADTLTCIAPTSARASNDTSPAA